MKNLIPNSIKKTRRSLKQERYSLKPGLYFINYPYACRIRGKVPKNLKNDFKKNLLHINSIGKFKKVASNLAFGFVWRKKSENQSKENFSFLYRSGRGHIKLFDVERDLILIDYKDPELASVINKFSLKNRYLPLNEIRYEGGSLIEEKYIAGEPLSNLSLQKKKSFYEKILRKFNEKHETPKRSTYWRQKDLEKLFQSDTLSNFIKTIKHDMIIRKEKILRLLVDSPVELTHGDLNFKNTIYKDGKFYVIDLEHVNYRPFFYDLIYLPFNDLFTSEGSEPAINDLRHLFDGSLLKVLSKKNNYLDVTIKDFVLAFLLIKAKEGFYYKYSDQEKLLNYFF